MAFLLGHEFQHAKRGPSEAGDGAQEKSDKRAIHV